MDLNDPERSNIIKWNARCRPTSMRSYCCKNYNPCASLCCPIQKKCRASSFLCYSRCCLPKCYPAPYNPCRYPIGPDYCEMPSNNVCCCNNLYCSNMGPRSNSADFTNKISSKRFDPSVCLGLQNIVNDPLMTPECVEELKQWCASRQAECMTENNWVNDCLEKAKSIETDFNFAECIKNAKDENLTKFKCPQTLEECQNQRQELLNELANKACMIEDLKKQIQNVQIKLPEKKKKTKQGQLTKGKLKKGNNPKQNTAADQNRGLASNPRGKPNYYSRFAKVREAPNLTSTGGPNASRGGVANPYLSQANNPGKYRANGRNFFDPPLNTVAKSKRNPNNKTTHNSKRNMNSARQIDSDDEDYDDQYCDNPCDYDDDYSNDYPQIVTQKPLPTDGYIGSLPYNHCNMFTHLRCTNVFRIPKPQKGFLREAL